MRGRRAWRVAAAATAGVALAAVALADSGLRVIDSKVDGVDGIDGLAGGSGVALSPDGKHVYAIGRADNAIASFKQRTGGTLRPIDLDRDGVGRVRNMAGPLALAVAPDGRHVYVSTEDDALVAFRRNGKTGRLRYLRALRDNVNGVNALAGPCCQIALTRNGRHLYITSQDDAAIGVFKRRPRTGRLSFVQAKSAHASGLSLLDDVIGVVVSRDGDHVYAAGSRYGAVLAFERRRRGKLRLLNFKRDGVGGVDGTGGACCSLGISRNGGQLFVPADGDDAVALFEVRRNGKVRFDRAFFATDAGFEDLQSPLEAIPSRDGKRLFVAAYGSTGAPAEPSAVVVLRRKRGGELVPLDAIHDGDPFATALGGVWRLAQSRDGEWLFASSFDEGSLVTFRRID